MAAVSYLERALPKKEFAEHLMQSFINPISLQDANFRLQVSSTAF